MLKAVVQNVVFAVLLGLLFLPAGTLAWPRAWIFLVLFVGCSHAIGFWLLKTDPALLAERMKSPLSADQRPRDRMVMGAIGVFLCAWLVFMALDARRFAWSHTPLWAQAIGAALILGAFCGWVGVFRANSFAAVTVRLQEERGQTVISTGPYAVVRHPMMAARALGEEDLLMDGLPGYRVYAAKVRFRLLPGVW